MRKSHVFVGSSHPELGKMICDRLGVEPGRCSLKKFSNGETSVEIGVSVRDEDVYVVQSGSAAINDHIMEMLILIQACRTGSANKITAVIPLFPYSKQSKMKKHRGAITARMLANLLTIAGADHVITMDLHATQMQGFFSKPVDNLYAGPTLARWIRHNVPDYRSAVIVSKNPGGTKRVTALADALKVNFAMIHTDRRRTRDKPSKTNSSADLAKVYPDSAVTTPNDNNDNSKKLEQQNNSPQQGLESDEEDDEVINVHGVQVARVVQGHVVDDDYPEDSNVSNNSDDRSSENGESGPLSNVDVPHALGGTVDASVSDDDEEETFHTEKLITLVGDVRGKTAIIVDDMIDGAGSYVAAAEHCRLNCGAGRVYILATHGIFGGDSLEMLNDSPCIDQVVVTNTYPIPEERLERANKLTVIDISPIFAECIRRNHHGESISALFEQLAFN
jgi:ribose-phosphate pyrophosphokinase